MSSAAKSPTTMSLEEAIVTRRSVRGFLGKSVPEETLQAIFQLAQHAPSNCNIQPWKVFVASGGTRDTMRTAMVNMAMSGESPSPDYDRLPSFEGVYRERQVDCAVELYSSMNIGREDKAGRMKASLRNFELFDAPHVVFIGMDKTFGVTVALDVGMYAQNLMLAMTAYGIGSCAQGSMRYYPEIVRETFGETEDTAILFGISFGYEDVAVDANATRIGRVDLSENVKFKA